MSSLKNNQSGSKVENKKKPKKNKCAKTMDQMNCTTKRSKTTVNWQQFLSQQNKEPSASVKRNAAAVDRSKKTPVVEAGSDNSRRWPGPSAVAIDCEMVGVGDGRDNMLARVSLVDEGGRCLYDTYVAAMEPVVDYRTAVSGVRPADLAAGKDFALVQKEVHQIMRDKIVVGHGVANDMKVLMLSHPKRLLRDTSRYRRLRELPGVGGGTPSLRTLAKVVLGREIQRGEHSSVEDAQATMHIYLAHRADWERELRHKRRHH